MNNNVPFSEKHYKKFLPISAGIGLILIATQPASAQDSNDPIADINAMVDNIGTITGGVITVIIAALTVRLGIKQVNRLMTKG